VKAYFQREQGCTANSTKHQKKLEVVYKGGTLNLFLTSWQQTKEETESRKTPRD
jgi:hypothetical protein